MQQIYKRTPMPKWNFTKAALQFYEDLMRPWDLDLHNGRVILFFYSERMKDFVELRQLFNIAFAPLHL